MNVAVKNAHGEIKGLEIGLFITVVINDKHFGSRVD